MKTVLSIETIAEYLSNHQRRRAFLRSCNVELLNAFLSETKMTLEAKEEEELRRMEEEENKKIAITKAIEHLKALGISPEDLMDGLGVKQPPAKSSVKRTAYRHPETGEIIHWARRGGVPKALKGLIEKYGKDGLEQFAIKD